MKGQVALFPRDRVKVLSFGGGLDSMAMLVDAIQRDEKPDLVIMANVGDREGRDPGEWPGTMSYLRDVVEPLAAAHGIETKLLETDESPIRGCRSLWEYMVRRRIIPSKQRRLCSAAAKVERIAEYLWQRYGLNGQAVEVWIGFDAAEEQRALRDPHAVRDGANGWRVNRFPLMETHGPRAPLCRCRSERLVKAAGLPVCRKSACTYCPHASRGDFITLQRELPEVFAMVAKLEEDCQVTRSGKILRYGYEKGDGTDPTLEQWVAKPYKPRLKPCPICGASVRATKATACDWLSEAEMVKEAA